MAYRPAGRTPPILLTGATGYIGGHLLDHFEQAQRRVRCLTRRPEALAHRARPQTEVVAGDLLDRASLDAALSGIGTAYYLVHSMADAADFGEVDRRAANNFAAGASQAGVRRIIYLGGLGSGDGLSAHLASRHEVGEILRRLWRADARAARFDCDRRWKRLVRDDPLAGREPALDPGPALGKHRGPTDRAR
jgi:nucleoside-diphosphate-sugar epimerase